VENKKKEKPALSWTLNSRKDGPMVNLGLKKGGGGPKLTKKGGRKDEDDLFNHNKEGGRDITSSNALVSGKQKKKPPEKRRGKHLSVTKKKKGEELSFSVRESYSFLSPGGKKVTLTKKGERKGSLLRKKEEKKCQPNTKDNPYNEKTPSHYVFGQEGEKKGGNVHFFPTRWGHSC